MTCQTIPFNRPTFQGKELNYIQQAIEQMHLSGDGQFTAKCHQILEVLTGAKAALLTHSCTAALEMSAMLCELRPGDEVIMPSFTFVSTANAVVLRGATPVFVDIREDTLNLDEEAIEAAITPKTKAIFVVHYAGVCCEMDRIQQICDTHGLVLVEDAAQALCSRYKGRLAGSFGATACISFHETKNVISGEGGALVINDESLIEKAEIIREKGTNRRNFFRGLVDKYSWVEMGSSFLPSELTAAFLYAQLERAEDITAQRMAAWHYYHERMQPHAEAGHCRLPVIPDHCEANGHMYYLILPDGDARDAMIAYLKERGILAPFHYVPLHTAQAGKKYCRIGGPLDVTQDLPDRLLRLPMFADVSQYQERVCDAVDGFFAQAQGAIAARRAE